MQRRILILSLLTLAAGATGCTTHTETFAGPDTGAHTDAQWTDQVWTAMVKTAESPSYSDWHVIENDVWADEGSGRIEIWRLLRRYQDPAGQWDRLEDQEWKFSIVLDPTDPPVASFKVRTLCVPSHSWNEADRYFNDVWTLLGGRRPDMWPAVPAGSVKSTKPTVTPPADEPEQPAPPVEVPNDES